jgi:aminoglycoside phosphotransferase (APT) family kinase protein
MPHKTIHEAARYLAAESIPKLARLGNIKLTPQLLRGMRWLENNAPVSDEPPVVVHVDYAFNNLIFDGDRLSAVLDWETAHLGDPADDIILTQFNLGVYAMPEFLKEYEAGTGRKITEYRIAYARLVKCVINAIAGLTALKAINEDDSAPLHMGMMAFKFMPLFGANIDELIALAESVRGR